VVQKLNGRRGSVFSVRVTDEERETLEALQRADRGPKKLGPWLVWRAIAASPSSLATPLAGGSGSTCSSREPPKNAAKMGVAAPSSGTTGSPGEVLPNVRERVILDLCAGSGSWSAPYVEAGYDVRTITLPDHDVRTFAPPPNVWGVLAAPPCDQFSIARNGCDSPRDFLAGLEVVSACMRIALTCRPRWWALENPVGLLSRWLGTPRDTFEPCQFGDPWTKRTALWGSFRIPVRGPFVAPLGAGPPCDECQAPRATLHCNNAAHRAITPPSFARAFFEANP
jgi:hypothetical protein